MEPMELYDRKTEHILRKYGPGPRVHYNIGIVSPQVRPAGDQDMVRRQLVQSQEDLLVSCMEYWGSRHFKHRTILDVGAGLGGPALWLAQNLGTKVDCLVHTPRHVDIIRNFAEISGVSSQIRVILSNANVFLPPNGSSYEVVMAVGSTGYFERDLWFKNLARIVPVGGRVFIEAAFVGTEAPSDAAERFDAYWLTRIGTVREYLDLGRTHGFEGTSLDITPLTSSFWVLSRAWAQLELAKGPAPDPWQAERMAQSIEASQFFLDYWQRHYYVIALIELTRVAP